MQRQMVMHSKHPMILHAKSFLAGPLTYLAARKHFAALGDQVQRWSEAVNLDAAWDERTAMMAGMVSPGAAVLEFGSGREQLEKFLPSGCHYQPSDLVARSSRTLVCDLNLEFPALSRHYDVIVFSGVIEYIHDMPNLLSKVRTAADSCLVSYATTDKLACMATRLANGWVNHYSDSMLRQLFVRAGFRVTETLSWQQQTIYRLV